MRYVKLMLRTCSRIIALTAMVAGPTAQAADTTLTLACKGTETSGIGSTYSSKVINIGIIVDLQKKTLVGLEPTAPLTIDELTETTISFSGEGPGWDMWGTLNRVTGSLVAFSIREIPKLSPSYELQCGLTQRMF
jgi:hypothetical protein